MLRYGRQYQRPLSNFGGPFTLPAAGELLPVSVRDGVSFVQSRDLAPAEVLVLINR
jgi:hypothetical protein